MAWLIDPRRWDDTWWTGLSPYAARIWDACLTGGFRTVVPGLCKGVSVSTLYDTCALRVRRPDRRCSVEQFEEDFEELQAPDERGIVHFYFDPIARVARIPMAPAYNQADNPNQLTAWYRAWRDIPDCDLKFEHIASLRLGVSFTYFDKQGRHVMADKWEATFGQPEKAFKNGGNRLRTYVDLRERWVSGSRAPVTAQGTVEPTVDVTVQGTLPFPGSGIRDQGSGIRDQGSGINTVKVTVDGTVSPASHSVISPQNQIEPIASSNGGVENGTSGSGPGPHGVAGGAGGRAGVAPGGGIGGRRSTTPTPGTVSASGRRLPPGYD